MITVVLPAYNEEDAIGPLLSEIDAVRVASALEMRTLVVNDASRDRTLERAEAWNGGMAVQVISHDANQGLGGALQTGLRAASAGAADGDILVTMDADCTHPPRYIPEMVRPILSGDLDVVIASRYAEGGIERGVPIHRRVLSRGASIAYAFLGAIDGIRDYSCGYRAMRATLIREAFEKLGGGFISETGFQATGEIVLKLRHLGTRFGEVGFELRYDLKPGVSKMAKFRTARNTVALLIKHGRFGRKPGLPRD